MLSYFLAAAGHPTEEILDRQETSVSRAASGRLVNKNGDTIEYEGNKQPSSKRETNDSSKGKHD